MVYDLSMCIMRACDVFNSQCILFYLLQLGNSNFFLRSLIDFCVDYYCQVLLLNNFLFFSYGVFFNHLAPYGMPLLSFLTRNLQLVSYHLLPSLLFS